MYLQKKFPSKDVSLSNASSYQGDVTQRFAVDQAYNGKTVAIMHYVNVTVQSTDVKVTNGYAEITVSSLSPFAIAVYPSPVVDTGVAFMQNHGLLVSLLLLDCAGIIYILYRKKTN